jgi:assimilatory nitrate reductase catalytic subunit
VWGISESELPPGGRSAYELLDSIGEPDGIRGLFIMGSNPVVSAPNAAHVVERLRELDFLVVADFFVSESAELADVVLPSAQWAEEDGTMTNLEGRVIRRRSAVKPPGKVRSDIDILCALGERLGKRAFFSYSNVAGVFDELRRASRGGTADYSGITYERIDTEQGVFWPCPADGTQSMSRLFATRFPTTSGKARFTPVEHETPLESPCDDFPWHVTTGRSLTQYQSGTQTRRVTQLVDLAPEPFAEIHPQQARRYGIAEGERVVIRTRRGSAMFKAKITADIRPDTVFVPFHWPGERCQSSDARRTRPGEPHASIQGLRRPNREGRCVGGWWSSATAWRGRACSRTSSSAAAGIGSR